MASHRTYFHSRAGKVRCDRARPQCSMCERRKLDCERPSRLAGPPPCTVLTDQTTWEELSVCTQAAFT
ncbi:hypothetical protein ASPBRDRAFT_317779 [Aspergillus brasiliensis CBS 101740]|uniref:Zn(2)-C6 fungal-type domain-containing protein n=1 Tax=Aspergillus brasiliensis (strain CBS 101740 / IMI 381727 / IBT 21946) TaxID=767769 RepID=A0A1L9U8Z3_ASPBC|nr:hypothetical protein ASPBRDRAFT_317779 [Aspergillus brasiliensis CBS 101740]